MVVVVDDEELILDCRQDAAGTMGLHGRRALTSGAGGAAPAGDELTRRRTCSSATTRLRDDETGLGVIEALRNEFNADIPALLITGDTDPDHLRQISESGLAVLHKPLHEDELHEAIRLICAPRALLQG